MSRTAYAGSYIRSIVNGLKGWQNDQSPSILWHLILFFALLLKCDLQGKLSRLRCDGTQFSSRWRIDHAQYSRAEILRCVGNSLLHGRRIEIDLLEVRCCDNIAAYIIRSQDDGIVLLSRQSLVDVIKILHQPHALPLMVVQYMGVRVHCKGNWVMP